MFIVIMGVTLLLSLLVTIAMLALAAPDTAASSLAADTNPLHASPISPNSLVGAVAIRDCDDYYFRGNLVDVGQDGDQQVADTTVPFAGVPQVASASLNQDTEIVRFYSNPPLTDSLHISEDITGWLWVNTSRPNASLNIKMFDYNPGNGAKALLSDFPITLLSAGEANVPFNIPPPAAPIPAGHRLLFVLEGKKGSPPPTVELRYDSVNTPSRFTVCQLIPGGTPPANTVYLPLIMTNKVGLMTVLYVESINTGGINPVRILDPSTNQELLSCPIGNNITQLCGSFPTPTNGRYILTAHTNNCGSLQGTFSDATPGGMVTRRIFCN